MAAEIRSIKAQTGALVLNASIEVGRRLTEAKAQLPHGKWGEYLKEEVDYSPSQAQNLMRIFREYGDEQQSLFGSAAKSQTFGNLTFSKALSLLAIPDEAERERFVAENDVEHMSVRELNEVLKSRDEAIKCESETAAALGEAEAERVRLEKELAEAQEKMTAAQAFSRSAAEQAEQLSRELDELRSRPVDVAVEVDTEAVEAARQAAIDEMTAKVDDAKAAKKQADEKRKVAEKALDAALKELADLKAKEPALRELTQEEKDALTAEAVEKAKAEDAERLRGLEKQLASADPNVAEFKVRFTSWQEEHRKMVEVLERIAQRSEEQASKLRQAVKAVLENQYSAYKEQPM